MPELPRDLFGRPAGPHIAERIRDIPVSCRGCGWVWRGDLARWIRVYDNSGCPWHHCGAELDGHFQEGAQSV